MLISPTYANRASVEGAKIKLSGVVHHSKSVAIGVCRVLYYIDGGRGLSNKP